MWNGLVSNGPARWRFASDYFDRLYELAVELIKKGLAYVDLSTPEQIREMRGWAQQPGTPSEYREQSPEQALAQFEKMKNGEFPDGAGGGCGRRSTWPART